jgi:hypothetical protein
MMLKHGGGNACRYGDNSGHVGSSGVSLASKQAPDARVKMLSGWHVSANSS